MKLVNVFICCILLLLLFFTYDITVQFIDHLHASTPKVFFDVDHVFVSIKKITSFIFIMLGTACIICALWCLPCR